MRVRKIDERELPVRNLEEFLVTFREVFIELTLVFRHIGDRVSNQNNVTEFFQA